MKKKMGKTVPFMKFGCGLEVKNNNINLHYKFKHRKVSQYRYKFVRAEQLSNYRNVINIFCFNSREHL